MINSRNNPSEEDPSAEEMPDNSKILSFFKKKFQNFSLTEIVKKRLPITQWLPNYTVRTGICDFIAGVTVALTVIPQGLAYAVVAGLTPIYGLYSAFMGCFVYCFLGTSKDITLGPTAIMSLMVASYGNGQPNFAIALSLICGIIQLFMGICRLGFLMNFLSVPIIAGFTSSAAIIIGTSQLKDIFGIEIGKVHYYYEKMHMLFANISKTRKYDLVLGIICLIILLVLRALGRIKWQKEPRNTAERIGRGSLWLIGTARNAFVVLMAAIIVAILEATGHKDAFRLTSKVNPGLPHFEVPTLQGNIGNVTLSKAETLQNIGVSGFAVVTLIGLLESIAISKAFARRNKYRIDATQELIAIGIANIFGSFVQAYPITGSFSRTAINSASGVMTPAGGVFTGAVVLVALAVLTPYFQYIPKAALAAIIIASIITMIEHHVVKKIWKIKPVDLIPAVLTFLVSFYEIEYGIMCGIGVSLMMILVPIVKPRIEKKEGLKLIKVNGGLFYPGVDSVQEKIEEIIFGEEPPFSVAVDCHNISEIDFTGATKFLELSNDLKLQNIQIIFIGVQDHIRKVFLAAGIEVSQMTETVDTTLYSIDTIV